MPLAIDSSSPPVAVISDYINFTDAFTPPGPALLLMCWAGNTGTGVDPGAPTPYTDFDTWTTDVWDHRTSGSPALDGQVAICHAYSDPPTADTIVYMYTGTGGSDPPDNILQVYVITGADSATPVGSAAGGRQSSGTSLTASYTAAITGGQGFMVISCWNNFSLGSVAAATGCTLVSSGTSGGLSYAVLRRTDPDDVLGVSTTLGVTGLVTGGPYHYGLIEVISVEAAIEAGWHGQGPRGQQQASAANY